MLPNRRQTPTAPSFLYQVVLPRSARKEILDELNGQDINRTTLLPDIATLDGLCGRLADLLRQAQDTYGHFQWGVQIRAVQMKHGLLQADVV